MLVLFERLKLKSPFFVSILIFTYVWNLSCSSSTSDMLFIRHGRSRVRHSNEKDHIRWGLKAFDNLTLEDYDATEGYDNDTIMLFGSDLWANENLTNYVNQTNIYGQYTKGVIKIVNNSNNNNNSISNINSTSNQNEDTNSRLMITTQIPLTSSMITSKKKLQKKKIMENIRKDVDKGLEYLKMHKNLQNDDLKRTPVSATVVDGTFNSEFTITTTSGSGISGGNAGGGGGGGGDGVSSSSSSFSASSIKNEIYGHENDEGNSKNDVEDKNENVERNLHSSKIIEELPLISSSSSLLSPSLSSYIAPYQNKKYTSGILSTVITNTSSESSKLSELSSSSSLLEFSSTRKNMVQSSSFSAPIERLPVAYYNKQQLLHHDEDETNSPKAVHNDDDDDDEDSGSIIKSFSSTSISSSSSNRNNNKKNIISQNLFKNQENYNGVENSSSIQKRLFLHDGLNQSAMNLSGIHENDGGSIRHHHNSEGNRLSKVSLQKIKINVKKGQNKSSTEKVEMSESKYDDTTLNDDNNNRENYEEADDNDSINGNHDNDDSGGGDSNSSRNYANGMSIGFEMNEETGEEEEEDEIDDVNIDDENNDDGENDEAETFNVYGTTDEDLSDLDEISRSNRLNLMKGRDVVTKFLQIVESQHLLGANCTAGTALNLGEGVVDQYAQDRFRIEAEVAVNRANMLTRIFKLASPSVQASEHLLHASVLSMVEFDDDIFAAGNCFDWNQHPAKQGLFCPFAYRLPPPDQGASFAKDLAAEYHYLGNTSEWFFLARKNAEKVIARNEQYIKAYHLYSNSTSREADEILSVKYEDGRWSKPYYDCGGGNIWMLTYTVPFFGYENGTYFFKGTSGIDIDLRRVDIDQCPQRNTPGTTQPLNIFAGTDKCKQRTTMCEAITGLGFRRGSYKCVCRKGFYFPDTTATQKYFNGSILEEEYEKLMLGEESTYSKLLSYECLPCAEGCDSCEDASPCVAALNWPMRTSILVLACAVIGLLPPAAWFTFRYQQVKVVRAASPALLRVIALGAFFIYCTTIVMYPPPSLYTCTARIWLREIGFSLTYGALMLKTWRISVIFRVRSAKAVKITDAALLKRLGVICGVIGACLLVRTIVSPPEVVVGRTADDLKAFLCKTDWWDYTFTSMEVLFLAWGVRLCIMVRKAPSEFNESRFISMAIYNEFLLTCFLNVSMLFLQSPANPDLLYIIFFCHTQLTVTLLLGLIFGSKVYIVLRSGKAQENAIGMGAKPSGAKFNFRPQIRTFANPSTATTSTAQLADTKLTDQEALEEIRQLSVQLQRIQELAPPKGIAVMTISSLLDGLKTTSHQISLRPPPASSLPTLAINNYQHQNNKLQSSSLKTSEKSINTSLLGDDIINNIEKMICNNCKKITLTSDIEIKSTTITTPTAQIREFCDKQTSPTRYFKSGNLSFSDLQLECMCSQSDDIDRHSNDNNNDCIISGSVNIIDHHYHHHHHQNSTLRRSLKQRHSNRSLDKSSNKHDKCTIIKNLKDDNSFGEKDERKSECETVLIQQKSIILDEKKLGDPERSKKRKFHSSCSLVQSKSMNSSPCDNHKSNEHFLICDNCKSNIVYNERRNEIKLDSQKLKSLSSPTSSSFAVVSSSATACAQKQQKRHQEHHQHQRIDDDDDDNDGISFHSSSSDDDNLSNKFCKTQSTTLQINKDTKSSSRIDENQQQQQQRNTEECCAGDNDGDGDENLDNASSSNKDVPTGTSSSANKGRNNRKSDKLVLDLNDRSKYTKEVSV